MSPGEVNAVMPGSAEDLGDLRKAVSWIPASKRESWDSELGEARRLCTLRAPRVGWVSELRADDVKAVSIERLCLFLLMSKNL